MSDRPIKLLPIDDDPIFRLGLATALNAFNDFQVIAQADSIAMALARLREEIPDIVILEPTMSDGWSLCQQIQQNYPDLAIFLFSNTTDRDNLLASQGAGVKGYAPKGTSIGELVVALRRVVAGETQWQAISSDRKLQQSPRRKSWLVRTSQSGVQQIDATLHQIQIQLDNPQLPLFDWLYWSGRKRELLASRWLINQLLPIEVVVVPKTATVLQESSQQAVSQSLRLPPSSLNASALVSQTSPASIVMNNTLAKIELGTENLTGIPLEFDIFQPDKKRELFYLAIARFEQVLEDLRLRDVTREELLQSRSQIMRDLLESFLLEFFSKNYTSIGLSTNKIIDVFSQDAAIASEEVLEEAPMLVELLGYFLWENSLAIDNVSYRPESPEAMARAEIILQNTIVNLVNAIVQILLNHFSEVEIIKQNLYQKKYLSSREIAQFRNNISWRYRKEKYVEKPRNIFESKYRLFILNGGSLKVVYIYAPRQDELDRLRGIPWGVTIALELRDALSPRLRAIAAFVGNSVVYLLTQVIGRAIGLIGRGIIQGIGNTLQETRYGKNGGRGK